MVNKKNIQFEQPSELLILFNRYLIIIIAVVVFAILIFKYFFLLKPKINTNNNLQIELSQIQNNEQTSQHLLDSLEKLKEQYENIQSSRQTDLDRVRQIIPANPQIAELFVVANRLAIDRGFKLDSISIVDTQDNSAAVPVDKNVNTLDVEDQANAAKGAVKLAPTKDILKILTLQISITKMSTQELLVANPNLANALTLENKTNYQLFKEYLVALEENLRLFDIQTIAFSSIPEPSLDPTIMAQPSFILRVVTYYR